MKDRVRLEYMKVIRKDGKEYQYAVRYSKHRIAGAEYEVARRRGLNGRGWLFSVDKGETWGMTHLEAVFVSERRLASLRAA